MAPAQPCPVPNSIAHSAVVSISAQRDSERLVVDYMMSSESGLDGSLHPALNMNDPRIEFVTESHNWKEAERDGTFDL
jgi:hypothetical protein